MKKQGILLYIILLSNFIFCQRISAQDATIKEKVFVALNDEQYKASPIYQGTSIGIDIWGLGGRAFGSDFTTTEAFVEVNLKNRFLPIFEIGYGSTNTTNSDTNIFYKTSAPFFKIGMNYNVLFRKPYLPGYPYIGFRIGYTSFSYDVTAPNLEDPIWGITSIPFSFEGIKSSMTWGELVAGLKTKVFKNFSMGWDIRYQFRFKVKDTENTQPWYVPGFGANKSSKFGVNYNLIYDLPF